MIDPDFEGFFVNPSPITDIKGFMTIIKAADNDDVYIKEDSPEIKAVRKLLTALIARSYQDLCSKEKTIRSEAVRWFTSPSRQEFSYLWVAEELLLPENFLSLLEKKGLLSFDSSPSPKGSHFVLRL